VIIECLSLFLNLFNVLRTVILSLDFFNYPFLYIFKNIFTLSFSALFQINYLLCFRRDKVHIKQNFNFWLPRHIVVVILEIFNKDYKRYILVYFVQQSLYNLWF